MSEGYRQPGEPLALPNNSAERIAALRVREDDDLPLMDAVAHWRQGIPPGDIDNARHQWEARWRELREEPNAARAAYDELFIRTIQLNNELPTEDGEALLGRAIEVQRIGTYKSTHRCMLAANAVRRGELAEARMHLMECSVDDEAILSDSAYRSARGLLALSEGDVEVALHCLGARFGAIPFAPAYRKLAMVYRAQALALAGRSEEAHDELDKLVAAVGMAPVARMLDRVPSSWEVDRTSLYRGMRADVRSDGWLAAVGATLCLLGALGGVAAYLLDGSGIGKGGLGSLILLLASAWLFAKARRHYRLAKAGRGGRGVVTGRSPSRWRRAHQSTRYHVQVEATLDGEQIFARSYETFRRKEADALDGKPIYLLWHSADPTRARVFEL